MKPVNDSVDEQDLTDADLEYGVEVLKSIFSGIITVGLGFALIVLFHPH